MTITGSDAHTGVPGPGVVDAALLLLERMGLTPADLLAASAARPPAPAFAAYILVVSALVGDGCRRGYGSYWNRVAEQWGDRGIDEPTPSEIRQLVQHVRAGVVPHLRIWATATDPPGYVAVVTETGLGNSVTESAGRIWAELVRRYGPSLVLREHHPAPELAEGVETLDLVRIGADGSPHWSRVWPTPEEHPRHAGLELWMAAHGHQIVSRPASDFDWCEDEDG